MLNNQGLSEKYDLVVSTLNLLLIPPKQCDIPYALTIKNCMFELEGDSYTFLHDINVTLLLEFDVISERAFNLIVDIRKKIEGIDEDKWTNQAFLTDKSWIDIRKIVFELYLEELK